MRPRKDVKKIRSALRLVRDAIGDDVWRRENEHYREAARTLSSFRDAEILVEALDGLGERFGPPARSRFDVLRRKLEEENRAAHDDGSVERAMTSAAAQLAAGRARIEQLPLDGDRWELIAPGLHRTYRRGRKRLRVALLREEVQHRRTAFADPGDQRHLLEEIDQRRGELQFAAISVGQRIYADKPKRFTKRVERRWEAWREREPVGA